MPHRFFFSYAREMLLKLGRAGLAADGPQVPAEATSRSASR
ncbi:hypothetical protein WKW80_35140 [Variovorax humicola]|uniref:Uncharacterized protein n=1 Tax=Variovorax humicola TaxID=1769758 RepID=A0ABU8WCG3_9BURK